LLQAACCYGLVIPSEKQNSNADAAGERDQVPQALSIIVRAWERRSAISNG